MDIWGKINRAALKKLALWQKSGKKTPLNTGKKCLQNRRKIEKNLKCLLTESARFISF
jgi:hypothetical protein